MKRRTVLAGACMTLLGGCLKNIPLNKGKKSGIIEALAVEEKPPDAEVTDRKEVTNPSIQRALENICENGKAETTVRVTGEKVEAVKEELRQLPSYSPSSESKYEYGNYVKCNEQYVVVRLLIED